MRRASTVCLIRDAEQMEVLMVQRPTTARFMPGAWVFPGGAVDEADKRAPSSFVAEVDGFSDDWKVAAARELIEETGLWLTSEGVIERALTEHAFEEVDASGLTIDLRQLIYFSNWITPEAFPIRFDTRFFVALVESDVHGSVDGEELIDLAWVNPIEALHREAEGSWDVAFPTRETLKLLATGSTASEVIVRMRDLDAIPPVQPRLYVSESEARILLPDDPEFDAAADAQNDPSLLDRLAAVVENGGHVPAEFKDRR